MRNENHAEASAGDDIAFDLLVLRYLDGLTTDDENASLRAQLAASVELRKAFVRLAGRHGVMAEVHGWCVEKPAASGGSAAEARVVRVPVQHRWSRFWIPLAVAASVAVVVGVWWVAQGRQPAGLGLRMAEVAGKCSVFSVQYSDSGRTASGVLRPASYRSVPVGVGMELRQGDRVVVAQGGHVGLKYDGEATTIELHSAAAAFGTDEGGKRVALDSGLLICTAAPQKKPFRLETPGGVAAVLGTRFALSVDRSETTLSVQEGSVAMSRGTNSLLVKGGEIVVADAQGLQKVAGEDFAWLQMLRVRAEVGPWGAVDFGKGALAQDGWRMDARGSPEERLIWNVKAERQTASILAFDTTRWKRGVLTGRIMMLANGQPVPETAHDCKKPDPQWHVYRQPLNAELREKGPKILLHPRGAQPEEGFMVDAFGLAKEFAGTWCRMVIYFDTEADGGPRVVTDCWVEDSTEQPPPRTITHGGMTSSAGSIAKGTEIGIGLVACDCLLKVNALKFVPLGSDMPQPPSGMVGHVRRWVVVSDPNREHKMSPGIGEAP